MGSARRSLPGKLDIKIITHLRTFYLWYYYARVYFYSTVKLIQGGVIMFHRRSCMLHSLLHGNRCNEMSLPKMFVTGALIFIGTKMLMGMMDDN